MSSREERIERAHSVWGTPWEGCDPRVASAMARCTLKFTARDSLTSKVRGRSIQAKVEKFFDNTFAELVQEIGAGQSDWARFSDLMQIDTSRSDYAIDMWGREAIQLTKTKFGARSSDYQRVRASVDSCRDFNHICHSYSSTRTAVLKSSRVGDELVFDIDEKRQSRSFSSQSQMPAEFPDIDKIWCQICPRLVQSEEHKLGLTTRGEMAPSSLPLQIKSLSSQYCYDHSPYGGWKYKRELKRRFHLFLMMRLIIDARLARNLCALDPETLHSHAYAIVCESGPIPKTLKIIHDYYFSVHPTRSLSLLYPLGWLERFCCQIVEEAKVRGYKPYRATRRGIQNKLFFVQRVVGKEFYMLTKAQLHRVGKVTLLLDPQGNVGLG